MKKGEQSGISLEAALTERAEAPVKKGDMLGEIRVKKDGKTLMTLPAVAGEDVQLPGFVNALLRIKNRFMLVPGP
jgi:D-alanyl-D-alanine carboxypeptidase (penicillin-binding protein 5/6)